LWWSFILVVAISFSVLLYYGYEIYQVSPPVPEQVVDADGKVLFTGQEIKDGQNVWQSIGGQEVGTIWGHGAYVAPDWTADWLHREALIMLDSYAQQEFASAYADLSDEDQAKLQTRLKNNIRKNTFNEETNTLTIDADRVKAVNELSAYYAGLFTDDPQFDQLRKDYAIPKNSIKDPERLHKLNAFFFWATWATVTERPGDQVSYTHNWPNEKLVGNEMTMDLLAWSGVSIILLIFCVGALVLWQVKSGEDDELLYPAQDPLLRQGITPSMRLTKKYFWIVSLLMLVQVGLGIVTAHYGVEGDGLYGIPLDQFLPYSVTRTWHTQLAIFWIATAWLATGLYIAPAVGGKDPKFQSIGVNFQYIALLIIVVCSMVGQWFGVMQKLDLVQNFWFGHQGYEYVDLGRFWQLFLFVGLFVWLALM